MHTTPISVTINGGLYTPPAQPTTRVLGPYTLSGADAGNGRVYVDEVVDLGEQALGIVTYDIALTAIDVDGGALAAVPIDFDSSVDGVRWYDGRSVPPTVDPASLPATAAGTVLLSRYARLYAVWNGDQGAASKLTFHVNLSCR